MKPSTRDLKAESIRAALLAIAEQHGGLLNPIEIVEAARDPDSILHHEFEWDDDAAAHAYRVAQAGALVRRVKLHILRPAKEPGKVKISTTREFQSRPSQRTKEGGYEAVAKIMADPDKQAELLQRVLRDLKAYRQRYAELFALRDVWAAIDDALELLPPEQQAGKPASSDSRPGAAG